MSPAERQQVIDALEASLGHLRKVEAEYMTADGQFAAEYAQLNEALAIMRREREETTVQHVHEWFSTGAMEPGQIRCISCGAWGRER